MEKYKSIEQIEKNISHLQKKKDILKSERMFKVESRDKNNEFSKYIKMDPEEKELSIKINRLRAALAYRKKSEKKREKRLADLAARENINQS